MSEENQMHFNIWFWTSAEIINKTHLIDDNQISEYDLHDQAMSPRFYKYSSISLYTRE